MKDAISLILSRLDGVRETKPNQWSAICPAHDDRNPSLSINNADDRVLIHCWAGCESHDVVLAIGLQLSDLFEQPIKWRSASQKRIYANYRQSLQLLRIETTFLWLICEDILGGKVISDEDIGAVRRAYRNIEKVMVAANV